MKKLNNKDLRRISIEEFKSSRKTPITLVLDNVRSALNVGSIFRTADAFLIENIILCGITTTPPNKEIRKVALGSTNSVNWQFEKNTLSAVAINIDTCFIISFPGNLLLFIIFFYKYLMKEELRIV